MKTMTISIPQNTNKFGGFYRTMHTNKRLAWATAVEALYKATGVSPAAIAVWLESTRGRHFADGVNETVHLARKNRNVVNKTVYAVNLEVRRMLRGAESKADFIKTANSWYAEDLTTQFPPMPGVTTYTFEKGEWVQRAATL